MNQPARDIVIDQWTGQHATALQAHANPAIVATRETLAETGVHCSVRIGLGSRIHPMTGVNARNFLCDYLAGGVENRDVIENTSALWAPKNDMARFVPRQRVFPPVLRVLEESNESDD